MGGDPSEDEDDDENDGLGGLDASPPRELVVGPSGKVYSEASLFCLKVSDEPRRSAILLCEDPRFDQLILATILANCTTMAWESPLDPPGTSKAAFIVSATPCPCGAPVRSLIQLRI